MAQKTITEFQQIDAVENADQILIYDNSVGITKKATAEQVLAEPSAHAADTNNPHAVTKNHVGLGNVTDDQQLKRASNLSDIPNPAAARTNLGVAAQGDMAAHMADTANPHAVTKSQVGLGNVTNDAQLKINSNLSDLGDAATARGNISAASDADLTAHTGDTGNPHTVTRNQLGVKHTKEWYIAGALSVGSEQGGVWICPRILAIEKAFIHCKTPGTAGSTIVDIHLNGTTIFTTQANRPQLQWDDADKKAESGTPEVASLSEGDIVSLDIDQIAAGAEDLSVILICR